MDGRSDGGARRRQRLVRARIRQFKLSDGALVEFAKLRKIAAVCTYQSPMRVVKRLVRWMPGDRVRCDYLAYHGMDRSTQKQRAALPAKVKRTLEAW